MLKENTSKPNSRKIRIGTALGGWALILLPIPSYGVLVYLGLLLVLLAALWNWNIGQFRLGRLVAVLIVVLGFTFDNYKVPEPPPPTTARGKANTVGDVKLNIHGVKIGMTRREVEANHGPAHSTPQGEAYQNGDVFVFYDSDDEKVVGVWGNLIHDEGKVYLKSGESAGKLKTLLGEPAYTFDSEVKYSQLDPDLSVKVADGKISKLGLGRVIVW